MTLKTAVLCWFMIFLLFVFAAVAKAASQRRRPVTARARVVSRQAATPTPTPTRVLQPGRTYFERLRTATMRRTYQVYVPGSIDGAGPAPLVIALHGRLGTSHDMVTLTNFNGVADREGFIVLYPDGFRRSWADGRGATPADEKGVDDVGYIADLIDAVSAKWSIDPRRIYAAGMSNGGFMAHRLACDLASRIAAIASVAALFSEPLYQRCKPARPVSALYINGTLDPLVPIGGGLLGGGDRGQAISLTDSVQKWVAINGCTSPPTKVTLPELINDGTTVTRETYAGCAGDTEVVAYVVDGGGHTWPGGASQLGEKIVGKTSRNLNASQTIWDFFKSKSLPGDGK